MKNIILVIIGIIFLVILFLVLGKKEKETTEKKGSALPQQEITEAKEGVSGSGKYSFDTNSSKVVWEGKKTFIKEWIDVGDIKIESGYATLLDNKITEAQVIVDMKSIQANKTGKGDGEDMLSRHLKSADFFDVENFPTASFTLTSINETPDNLKYNAEGNLTIKGTTKKISFPVGVYMLNDDLIVEGEIVVDRTEFDIRFGSTNFFKDIGDNAIDNDFVLKVKLVAKKS